MGECLLKSAVAFGSKDSLRHYDMERVMLIDPTARTETLSHSIFDCQLACIEAVALLISVLAARKAAGSGSLSFCLA